MQPERVSPLERRKAAFIGEYERLCRRHRLMVAYGIDGDVEFFSVADFQQAPKELEHALDEMRICPIAVLMP